MQLLLLPSGKVPTGNLLRQMFILQNSKASGHQIYRKRTTSFGFAKKTTTQCKISIHVSVFMAKPGLAVSYFETSCIIYEFIIYLYSVRMIKHCFPAMFKKRYIIVLTSQPCSKSDRS